MFAVRITAKSPAGKANDTIGRHEVLHKMMLTRKTRQIFRALLCHVLLIISVLSLILPESVLIAFQLLPFRFFLSEFANHFIPQLWASTPLLISLCYLVQLDQTLAIK